MGYLLCIVALVWTLRGAVLRVWYLPLVLAVMAARELDLDKSLFTRGLFKARQYTGEGVPLAERLIAALILASIVTAIFLMLWRHARPYLSALWHGRAWAGAVLMGIGFTVAYKLLDGIARKLAPWGSRSAPMPNAPPSSSRRSGSLASRSCSSPPSCCGPALR